MAYTVAQTLARLLIAIDNCQRTGNDYGRIHAENLDTIVRNFLPSGSGWDNGTTLDRERSTPEKLVFVGAFHHMNEHGYYNGWTEHTIDVTASLAFGLNLRVTGRNRNDIKDYLAEMFQYAITREIIHDVDSTGETRVHTFRLREHTDNG